MQIAMYVQHVQKNILNVCTTAGQSGVRKREREREGERE